MELNVIGYCLLILFSVYCGFKMGRGEAILEIPRKLKKSVKTEEQQAELEKKLMDQKDVRRALNGR